MTGIVFNDRYQKVLFCLLFILMSFTILASGTTDTSSIIKDYVKKVYDLNYPELYGEYPELKTIQTQLVSSLQGRIIDQETKNYVDIIVKIINSFNEIHSLSESDNPDNHESAITKAESIWSDIESLEKYKEPREKFYPLLTKLSLRRFYKNEAEYFANKAKNEQNTYSKIKFSLNEARAYKNIGDPKYAEISYRAEELKAEYEYDIKAIKVSIQNSNEFLNSEKDYNNGFFSGIELYGQGFQLEDSMTNAIRLSNNHEETQLKTQGEELLEKIKIIQADGAVSLINYVSVISIIYLTVSLYIYWSITRWKTEIYNVDLGNDLLGGLILE